MNEYFLSSGRVITKSEIEQFCNENYIKLPLEYQNFLLEVNGGVTHNRAFELAKFDLLKKRLDFYIDIDEFYSIDQLKEVYAYIGSELASLNLFPIADVAGGAVICCLQGDKLLASIFYYDYSTSTVLTESLEGFLGLLIPESDVDFKKYGIDY
jgi:hypothetical protein